jgi:hypothetical protein
VDSAADLFKTYKETEWISRARKLDAYKRWFHQACIEGDPPDALVPRKATPEQIFKAKLIEGLDGHWYWDGYPAVNVLGTSRRPVRLALFLRDGVWPNKYVRLHPKCGEKNCIRPEHQEEEGWGSRTYWTKDRILASQQVAVMRLGHAPTRKEWERNRYKPSGEWIIRKFHSWEEFLAAGGQKSTPPRRYSNETMLKAVREATELLGRPPTQQDWFDLRSWLKQRGYPSSPSWIKQKLNMPWSQVIQKAGS